MPLAASISSGERGSSGWRAVATEGSTVCIAQLLLSHHVSGLPRHDVQGSRSCQCQSCPTGRAQVMVESYQTSGGGSRSAARLRRMETAISPAPPASSSTPSPMSSLDSVPTGSPPEPCAGVAVGPPGVPGGGLVPAADADGDGDCDAAGGSDTVTPVGPWPCVGSGDTVTQAEGE